MKQAKRIAFGTLLALGVYLALCALLALLLTRGVLSERRVSVWAWAFAMIASFAGAAAARGEGKRVLSAAVGAASFLCALLLLCLTLGDGAPSGERSAVLASAILTGAALSLLQGGQKKRSRVAHGRRKRARQ